MRAFCIFPIYCMSAISCLAFTCPDRVGAAEVAGMDILIDGKQVAGYAMTYNGESEKERWLLLKKTSLTFERDFKAPNDPSQPDRATLRGKIRLQASRRNRPGTAVVIKQLTLERRKDRWYVTDDEVDRTLRASGLKD